MKISNLIGKINFLFQLRFFTVMISLKIQLKNKSCKRKQIKKLSEPTNNKQLRVVEFLNLR